MPKKMHLKKWIKVTLGISLFLCFYITIKRTEILTVNVVNGESMLPEFKTDDIVIVSNIPKINRYDIVTATSKSGTQIIKRVIGVPGDTVTFLGTHVFINNELSDESFLDNIETSDYNETVTKTLSGKIVLASDEYFLVGDNRTNSIDSRIYGPVKRENIHGKVIARN